MGTTVHTSNATSTGILKAPELANLGNIKDASKDLLDKYNEWRTSNPYRPFRIYHLKLIVYLILQIVEWLTDLAVITKLEEAVTDTDDEDEDEGRQRIAAIIYVFFLFLPWIIVGSFIAIVHYTYLYRERNDNNWPNFLYILPFITCTIFYYAIMDICYIIYFAIVEFFKCLLILMKDLCFKKREFNEKTDWIYVLPAHIRNYFYYRGISQIWFETTPHLIILFIIALIGYLKDAKEILASAIIVNIITFLMNLNKILKFYKKSKLSIYKPAFYSVYALVFNKVKEKKYRTKPFVSVRCSVPDFPWVDLYNEIYMKMLIAEIPDNGLEYFKNVCKVTLQTWRIQEFHVPNCHIADAGPLSVNYILEAMRKNRRLEILNLSNNLISDHGSVYIAELIEYNTSLTEINLRHNKISEGINSIFHALRINTTLLSLDVSYNDLMDYCSISIQSMLRSNFKLKDLLMIKCNLSKKVIEEFGKGLCQNTSLKRLWIRHNDIKDEGLIQLSRSLAVNNTLREIALEGNNISDIGVIQLCGLLIENSSLTTLELVGNNISDRGAEELGKFIRQNQMLKKLYLSANNIGDKGAIALAKGLEKARFLEHISLVSNKISNNGAAAFGQALIKNLKLKELYLGRNDIHNDGLIAIANGLKNNEVLKILSLDGNLYTDPGAMNLRIVFNNNFTLNVLDLEKTNLSIDTIYSFEELDIIRNGLTINFKHTLLENHASTTTSIAGINNTSAQSEVPSTELESRNDIPLMEFRRDQFINSDAIVIDDLNSIFGNENMSTGFYEEKDMHNLFNV